MIVELWLVRHGMTPGNYLGKYVGRTDEALSIEGRRILAGRQAAGMYPQLDSVYVSPMRRCVETAEILFPAAEQHVLGGMQECDFGDFEYKNYQELNGQPAYQTWIDSGGTAGFPGGETLQEFQARVIVAFDDMMGQLVSKYHDGCLHHDGVWTAVEGLVAHGGSLMAILDRYARPHRDYFEWQAQNGCGYVVRLDTDQWVSGNRFLTVQSKIEAPKT